MLLFNYFASWLTFGSKFPVSSSDHIYFSQNFQCRMYSAQRESKQFLEMVLFINAM